MWCAQHTNFGVPKLSKLVHDIVCSSGPFRDVQGTLIQMCYALKWHANHTKCLVHYCTLILLARKYYMFIPLQHIIMHSYTIRLQNSITYICIYTSIQIEQLLSLLQPDLMHYTLILVVLLKQIPSFTTNFKSQFLHTQLPYVSCVVMYSFYFVCA